MSVDMTMFVNYEIQGILKPEEISVLAQAIEEIMFKDCFVSEPALISVHVTTNDAINDAIGMFREIGEYPIGSRDIACCTDRIILWRSNIDESDKISLYANLFPRLEPQLKSMKETKTIYNVAIFDLMMKGLPHHAIMFTLDCGKWGYIVIIVFAKSDKEFTGACNGLYGTMCLLKILLAGKLPDDREPAGIPGYVDKATAADIRQAVKSWFSANGNRLIDEAANSLPRKK